MNWNLTVNGAPANPANNLVAAIYDPSAPTVVIQSYLLPGPFPGTFPFSFTGLDEIIYNFKLWETPGTTPAGTVRNDFNLQPTQQTTIVRPDLFLKADVSANFTSDTSSYIADTPNDLTGWTYDVERVGQGTQIPGVKVAFDTNGFHLLSPGDAFAPGEDWVLHFLPQVAAGAPVTAPSFITGTQVITADITLTNSVIGKAALIQGTGSSLIATLPALSTVADNKLCYFLSAGGNHINAVVKCAGSDTFLFSSGAGGTPTRIVLSQNEQLWLFKNSGKWNIAFSSPSIRMRGEIVYNYSKLELNTYFANGTLISRTTYAGLWDYAQTLEASVIITDALWNTGTSNMGKWSTGDGSTTFRVPKIYLAGVLKPVDGSGRLPGSLEAAQVGEINQTMKIKQADTSTSDVGIGKIVTGSAGNEPRDSDSITIQLNMGKINLIDNYGVYALIRI